MKIKKKWLKDCHNTDDSTPGGAYTCASFVEKNVYEVNFCWNVLIGAPGRRLYQKIINPIKVLACVKLLYYIGFN